MNKDINMLRNELKKIYKQQNLKRTFNITKDKQGIYIHPKNKEESFLTIGKKRIGLFINKDTSDTKRYLIEVDDELRRSMGIQ